MPSQNRSRSHGLVGVIEAAYDFDDPSDDERWIEGIVEALRPRLDRGFGVGAYLSEPRRPFVAGCERGLPNDWADPMNALLTSSIGSHLLEPRRPAQTGSQAVGKRTWESHEIVRREWHPRGIRDGIGLVCADGTGRSVTFFAPAPTTFSLSAETNRRYELLAGHISAGLRLRRGLRRDAAAVVTPDGKILHAEGRARDRSAREQLRDAALAVERAREPAGDDSRISLWKVLVAGEWSLVDQFESDGKRFLIARQNAPQLTEPRALTPRERQVLAYSGLGHSPALMAYELGLSLAAVAAARDSSVRKLGLKLLSAREREVVEHAAHGSHNKAIADDLGISHSTVKVLMSRAAAKLGVRTRAELLAKLTALGEARGAPKRN